MKNKKMKKKEFNCQLIFSSIVLSNFEFQNDINFCLAVEQAANTHAHCVHK